MVSDNNLKEKNKSVDEKINNFQFLDDEPISKLEDDSFGCHRRVAESIASQVESGQRSKTIGLEGAWGSGKSSVIKMLESKWEDNQNIKVFTYDAWEHQGDSLRRSFLEELIKFFTVEDEKKANWLETCNKDFSPEQCNEDCKNTNNACPVYIRNNLRQRYEHNVIKSEPHISPSGIVFGIATLLMPIGIAAYTNDSIWFLKSLCLLLMFAPALIILFKLSMLLKDNPKKANSLIGEFFGKSRDETRHTTQRSPEPTTIEFQEYYWNLLEVALKDENRKLVVVIDNLDRIDSDEALKIWATLKTFLDDKKIDGVDERVWVIVPYDSEAIESLWEKENNLSLAFKEKTFQIKYSVSPPLTSKWEDYFYQNLYKAIPALKNNDISKSIFQIYNHFKNYKSHVTPRNIIIFINRLVALAQQHYPEDATLEQIALYVSFEQFSPKRFENLATYDESEKTRIALWAGEDYLRSLASIHHQVPQYEAYEVLFELKITEATKLGSPEILSEIIEHKEAERLCCHYIGRQAAYWNTFEDFLHAANAFSNFKPKTCSDYIKDVFKKIGYYFFKNISKDEYKIGKSFQDCDIESIKLILDFCPEHTANITKCLSISMWKQDYEKITEEKLAENLSEWVVGTIDILKYIESKNEDPNIYLSMSGGDKYKKLINVVIQTNKNYLKYFNPKPKYKNTYLEACLAEVKAGTIDESSRDMINAFIEMEAFEDKEHSLIAKALTSGFTSVQHTIIPIIYEILFNNKNIKAFKEAVA